MSLAGIVNDATVINSRCGYSETLGSWSECGRSSSNSCTHFCIKCDYNCDSSLTIESEDSDWISDSKPYRCSSENLSTPLSTNGIPYDISEDNILVAHVLLEIEDMKEVNADGPLFWPFDGKFNWIREESWRPFCISPRRRVVFGSRTTTSRNRINESKHKDRESVRSVASEPSRITMSSKDSSETGTLELNDEKAALKDRKDGNKLLFVDKTVLNDDRESNYDFPLARQDLSLDQEPEIPIETLVGLEEFDGREGLDSEFNGDVFMLEESHLI